MNKIFNFLLFWLNGKTFWVSQLKTCHFMIRGPTVMESYLCKPFWKWCALAFGQAGMRDSECGLVSEGKGKQSCRVKNTSSSLSDFRTVVKLGGQGLAGIKGSWEKHQTPTSSRKHPDGE